MTILSTDTFNRTVASNTTSWGTSSDGHAWASLLGSAPNTLAVSTTPTAGLTNNASLTTAQASNIYYLGTLQTDGELLVSFGQVVTTNAIVKLYQRASLGTGISGYCCYLSSTLFVIAKVVGNTSTVLFSMTFLRTTTDTYWIRFRVQGTTLSGSVWTTGSVEPSTWMVTGSDSTYASGIAGIGGYPSGGILYYGSYSFDDIVVPTSFAVRARAPFRVRSVQRTRTQGRVCIRTKAGQATRSKEVTRASSLLRAGTSTRTQARIGTPLHTRAMTRVALLSLLRTADKNRVPLGLAITSHFVLYKAAAGITLMFVTFSEVAPTGYAGGIKPYTTIATQLLVTDQGGFPVNGLTQCNVTVTDPLGISTQFTLANAIIGLPGGKYWCSYTTSVEGIYTELWSLIAPDGIEIASHKNSFRAAYS